ncbi:MAG: hypothetical protein RL748_303 [Pseudomonadota bacterium]
MPTPMTDTTPSIAADFDHLITQWQGLVVPTETATAAPRYQPNPGWSAYTPNQAWLGKPHQPQPLPNGKQQKVEAA